MASVEDNTEATPKGKIEKIESPTNVQHVTHVTWSKEKGFEINTDDEELAKTLRKTLSSVELKTEEDVIQYVSKEFDTTKQDDDIYISYPYNVRHEIQCTRNKDEGDFNIVKGGSVVKLHIERFLKKHVGDKDK